MVDSAFQTAHQCSGAQGSASGFQDLFLNYPYQRIIQIASDNTTVCGYININNKALTLGTCLASLSTCLPFVKRTMLFFQQDMGSGVMNLVAGQLLRSHQILHTEWSQSSGVQVIVSDMLPTSNISLCHKIESQTSLVCVSSAISLGSGSKCPGDELVQTFSFLLPPTALCPLFVLIVAPLWKTKEWLQDQSINQSVVQVLNLRINGF